MQVSFRRTLVAYTLIVVILATVGTSFYCIQESRKQSIHVFDEGCKAACRIAGMAAAGALDRGDFETAHGQLKQLVRHDTSIIGAGVFSASGDPVVPYVGASRFGRRLTDPGAYSRTKNEFQSRYAAEQLRVTGPLVNSRGELLGFLSVDYALHQAYSVQHAITVKSIELTATFVFFSAVLAIALSWKVTRPIIAITEAAREISRRKFEVRVKSTRQQELNTLVTTINAMAEELEQTTVSKEYVSGIIDSMHDGLLVARRDGVVEMVNPAMCRLTDNESEDLVGQSIGSVLQTLAGDPYDAIDLLIDQVPEGVDAYLVNRDGGRTAVSVSSAAIGPDCGIHARYVVVMKDITVRKETELALDAAIKEAQLASRVKSEFLANMSHELRTPMNSIIGFTKRLITKLGDSLDERHLDALNTVDRNAKHLLGLINDILDLSKIEAGRMDLKRDSFDFAAAIREVVHQTDTLADGTAIRFVSEIPDEPIGIEADRIKVVQIATNLISNAIKYTNEGEVRVRVVEDIDRDGRPVAVLEVQDTGVGIKPDDLQRLFQKFSQLNSGSSRPVGGTGLGLYITASYIEMHGGRIKVASEYGAGSVFTAILPLVAAEPTDQSEPGSTSCIELKGSDVEEQVGAAITILCVDDDRDSRKLLRLTFEDSGFNVLTADGFDSAVRLAKKYEPDLICLDIKMPGKSGYEVMETLSEDPKLCSIPVVVVSSASDEAAELDNHAHCYLTKPIDAADLLSVVQQTLVQKIDSVLIVEDDPVIAMLLGQAFREHDVHVVTATNGEEGLQRLGEGKPSAILLDLMMPVMDGFQFLRTIRQDPEFADLPVVVLTSKTLTSTDIQFLGELSDFVFSKESYSAAQVIIAILTASRSERTPREITK